KFYTFSPSWTGCSDLGIHSGALATKLDFLLWSWASFRRFGDQVRFFALVLGFIPALWRPS
ncbi:hypothetical protein, partial [Heyndrickxia sporothermodurans]|uniref:hypothetical protein n=1 Tax=Heyndrickxia sporothermodurans TaxID=46224 RepID=UPI00196A645A